MHSNGPLRMCLVVVVRLNYHENNRYCWVQKKRHRRWPCRCQCGKSLIITSQELNKGQKSCKGCIALAKTNHTTMLGKEVGTWRIIEFVGLFLREKDPRHQQDRVYKCNCIKCGYSREFRGNAISVSGLPRCSKCLDVEWAENTAYSRIYALIELSAKHREIEVTINAEFLKLLYFKQKGKCALSGVNITIPKTNKEMTDYSWTASVDRINSDLGYTENNCQFVHKEINTMKMALVQDKFISWCKAVASHNTNYEQN